MQATESQAKIFTTGGRTVYDFENTEIFPLYKSGQHRSAGAMERRGYGRIVSSSKNRYHAANYFFKFENGFRFNYITHEITDK